MVVVARRHPEENKVLLRDKLENITKFLENNELSINQTKTKTQDYMVRQKRVRDTSSPTVLVIETVDGQKNLTTTLGLNLHRDLSWRSHLELGPKPLLPTLRRRLGTLQHLGRAISRKGRQTLTNGLILSKIIYMLPVWGGTHSVHIQKIQTVMNRAARYVVGGGTGWSTTRLMEACKWLKAAELVDYHTMVKQMG